MGFHRFETKKIGLFGIGLLSLILSSCAEGVDPKEQVAKFFAEPPSPPPATATGTHTFSVAGGNGTAGNGGNGGDIMLNGLDMPVRLVREGSVDAGFVVPTESENLGSNPRNVTGNVSINLDDGAATCPNITPDGSRIPGDDSTKDATGLKVAAGATLTLAPDSDCGGVVFLSFLDDVVIEGTIRSEITTIPNHAALFFSVGGNFLARPGSVIDTSGDDNPAGSGGLGGNFTALVFGKVLLQGSVDTFGGNATTAAGNGGAGGVVFVSSTFTFHNTGTVVTSGGTAAAGNGGNGGAVTLIADNNCEGHGGLFNSGVVAAAGGNGSGNGGNGGTVFLITICNNAGGDLFNSATLTASGGNATTAGNGGTAGDILLQGRGRLRNSGNLFANGGEGLGDASFGGAGGIISINNDNSGESDDETLIAGNLSGNGGGGGNGGSNPFTSDITGPNLRLFSFASLHLHGGSAADNGAVPTEVGGDGGNLDLLGSDVRNELEIHSAGGAGTGAGSGGGDGGTVEVSTNSFANFGKITTDGGAGVDLGGNADFILFNAKAVINNADLSAKGGAAGNATLGVGGFGSFIGMDGSDLVSNSGAVDVSGGDGPLTAGSGGTVHLDAIGLLTNSGALTANGGNANAALANSVGGFGGIIDLSTKNQPTSNSGVLSVVKGTGSSTSDATDGNILIDGSNVNPGDGTLP